MKISNRKKGQTLIETALILFVILIIVLGIAEFARAWYTKNSLKNAARSGARVAVVTPAANITPATFTCTNLSCPDSNVIKDAICCQPGIPKKPADNTTVAITCFDKDGISLANCSSIVAGGTVQVSITSVFELIVGDSPSVNDTPWPWAKQFNITGDASMRYE